MAKAQILLEMEAYIDPVQETAPPPGPEVETTQKKKGFWAHYEAAFGQHQGEANATTGDGAKGLEAELNSFLNETTFAPKHGEKIAEYWSLSSYKRVCQVAHKYLCVPPCTVFSERLFSVAGNICDSKRNRLDPDRIKMLVFLNRNLE